MSKRSDLNEGNDDIRYGFFMLTPFISYLLLLYHIFCINIETIIMYMIGRRGLISTGAMGALAPLVLDNPSLSALFCARKRDNLLLSAPTLRKS